MLSGCGTAEENPIVPALSSRSGDDAAQSVGLEQAYDR
jgi:hypothetical protein